MGMNHFMIDRSILIKFYKFNSVYVTTLFKILNDMIICLSDVVSYHDMYTIKYFQPIIDQRDKPQANPDDRRVHADKNYWFKVIDFQAII
jgi:hypothetical protein